MGLKEKSEWDELTDLQQDVLIARDQHPDWTLDEIADEVDSDRSHVSRIVNAYRDLLEQHRDELTRLEEEAEEPGANRCNGRVTTTMGQASFTGKPLDATQQTIAERPVKGQWFEIEVPDSMAIDMALNDELSEHFRRQLLKSVFAQCD